MSSSSHIGNKKKDILIVGKGLTRGLEHTLTAEKLCSITFTKETTKFCLNLHCNGVNSYFFVNGTEIIKFEAKDSEITVNPVFRKYFKRLVSRLYEKECTKRLCL